jgi:protocatechuate 3,4-dioxygenase beta subunit
LDPALLFRVLVAAPGHQPQFVTKVDPTKGPLNIKLERQRLAKLGPKNKLLGRVVDPQGRPIPGAKVDFEGVYNESGGGSFGAIEGVDPLAVTDEKGEFLLTSEKPFAGISVTVSARAFANRRFSRTVRQPVPGTFS